MSETLQVDSNAILRVTDSESNVPLESTGRKDFDQTDYLEITGNGSSREITIAAKNDGETPTSLPIAISGLKAGAVEAHTADDTLTPSESGSIHTTVGATGTVTFTLPAAAVGLEYKFKVGAAQELRIDPNGSETIALPSTGVQGAAGKYLTANAAGETVYLVCDTAGEWSVYGYTGTWTAEA